MKKELRLGVDLGGTSVKAALVTAAGRVVLRTAVATSGRPRDLAAALARELSPRFFKGARGTGVGVAGDTDSVRGVVRYAPNLGWKNVPLKSLLAAAGFPKPIVVENDANAAAWGAWHVELGRRPRTLAVLTLGTGVGGGLIIDGKIFHGATGTAGEFGHLCVDPSGPVCACGARGCLEAVVGNRRLSAWAEGEYRRCKTPVPGDVSPKGLEALARSGDPVARAAWERMGRSLGVGIAGLLNVLNPDAVLLTGGMAAAAPHFLPALRREVSVRAFAAPRKAGRIRVSSKNNDLGVIGAALLVP